MPLPRTEAVGERRRRRGSGGEAVPEKQWRKSQNGEAEVKKLSQRGKGREEKA